MQQSPPVSETDTANSLTIEAGSAESALEEVSRRLGPNAEIVNARKVHKGGIGGFFARELVQITARPRSGEPGPFGAALENAMNPGISDEERETVAAQTERSSADEPEPPAPRSSSEWRLNGGALWSVTALARADLPTPVTQAVMGLDPRDDLGWVAAIAGAVAPLCRPLPSGPGILVGGAAGRMGAALQMEVVTPPELAPYRGEFAAPVRSEQDDLDWLDTVRGERWLHLVVGEGNGPDLLDDEVLAVSWSGDHAIAPALRLASSLGLVLGFGMGSELGAPAHRATPIDVALAVRKLVGRR